MPCIISRRTTIAAAVFAVIFFIIMIACLGLLTFFNTIVGMQLAKSISISPTSAIYKNWVSPDTPVMFAIRLFNITNREEIEAGIKPRLREIGPYVYREKREKTNITFHGTNVSYYQRITYFFDRGLSVGDPDTDTVVGLSIPLVSLSANIEAGQGPSEFEYTMMSYIVTPQLFIETSVSNFIWGYVDPVLEACNIAAPQKCRSPKVGVMYEKNGTDDGPFTVATGVDAISQVGRILTYKNKSTVDVWSTPEAGMINGTDGSQVAPGLDINSTRYIFSQDLCRSFLLKAMGVTRLTNSDKLEVFSFGGTAETAEHASVNPNNLPYCPPKSPGPKCPPQGLFDLSSCRASGGIHPPVYSSQPRFLGADPSLREALDGIDEPSFESSATKVLIEPTTGLVLEAAKRLQISVFVKQTDSMSDLFKNFSKPTFFPIVWFEESAIADAASLDMLYENLYVKPTIGFNILLIIFGVFLFFFILCLLLICLSYVFRTRSSVSCKSPDNKKSWGLTEVHYSPVKQKKPNEGNKLAKENICT